MTRTMRTFLKQNKEPYHIPRRVQDLIPIKRIWDDGLFLTGTRYSKVYQFSDINYYLASEKDQRDIFEAYGKLLNSLDSGVLNMISIRSARVNQHELAQKLRIPEKPGKIAPFCRYYNDSLLRGTGGADGFRQNKYLTIAVYKRNEDEARRYFDRKTAELGSSFQAMGVQCAPLSTTERLRILHDFYRPEDQEFFGFDYEECVRRGDDPLDYICPGIIERDEDYLKIGNFYCRVLFLKGIASNMKDILIPDLTDLSRNMMITLDAVSVPTDEGVKEVEKKLLGVETTMANYSRRQANYNNYSGTMPRSLEQQREESVSLLDGLTSRDKKMFFGSLTVVHTAKSLEELNSDTEAIKATAGGHACQIETLYIQQQDGLNTALPIGVRKYHAFRTMDTECASIFIPFRVQEIQQPGGMLLGTNSISKNLILCDRKKLPTPHGFYLGESGSGKSMGMKDAIWKVAVTTDDDIMIIDAEREYAPLTRTLGGEVIEISPKSNHHINPLDVAEGFEDGSIVAAKSEVITSILEQQTGTGRLNGVHKSIIDRCTNNIYRPYLQDPAHTAPPLLTDWRREVMRQPEPEARELALISELITEGSMDVFAHATNVQMDSRIVTLDLYEMGEQLRPSALVVALEAVQNRVVENRRKGKYTWVFIEEAYLYFKYHYSAEILYRAFKRWRKYGGIITAASQNVEECLNSETARLMFANSEFLMLFSQAPTDQQELADLLKISENQMRHVDNAAPGTGLLKYGSTIVPFTNLIPTDSELYKLITTKPTESAFGVDLHG